jgi:hypothetical protein
MHTTNATAQIAIGLAPGVRGGSQRFEVTARRFGGSELFRSSRIFTTERLEVRNHPLEYSPQPLSFSQKTGVVCAGSRSVSSNLVWGVVASHLRRRCNVQT